MVAAVRFSPDQPVLANPPTAFRWWRTLGVCLVLAFALSACGGGGGGGGGGGEPPPATGTADCVLDTGKLDTCKLG